MHCVWAYDYLHPPVPIHAMIASILDVGLTSCVGLSWSFNALVDVGLVHESWRLYLVRCVGQDRQILISHVYQVMAASFISLIAAWTVQLSKVGGPSPLMFGALYFGPILISGILYSCVSRTASPHSNANTTTQNAVHLLSLRGTSPPA